MSELKVYNPATGDLLASLPMDSEDTIVAKLKAGHEAFKTWRNTSVYERAALLSKWGELILQNKEAVAKIMTEENGKPL